jgi:tRNA modification GTPase
MNQSGIIISLLTPPGRGAVASILVAGSGAIELVSRFFSPASGRTLGEFSLGRVAFGSFRSLEDAAEEVVVGLHAQDHVEIHCHGGPFAAAAMMKTLGRGGAEETGWEQVADRFQPDCIAAEAQVALASARTEKTALVLLDQYHGALRNCLAEAASAIESQIADITDSLARLEHLLTLAPLGRHLTQPWRVFIAGPPNVGKSSLMNALVGYQRSIVFDQPGTTRDLLTATTALDGWPIEFVDSAGLREGAGLLEAAGIARAESGLAAADLVLWVQDATQPAGDPPRASSSLIVNNKADLLSGASDLRKSTQLTVSAVTGFGLDELCRQIVQRIVPVPPARGEAVLFTERQDCLVADAVAALREKRGAEAIALLRSL